MSNSLNPLSAQVPYKVSEAKEISLSHREREAEDCLLKYCGYLVLRHTQHFVSIYCIAGTGKTYTYQAIIYETKVKLKKKIGSVQQPEQHQIYCPIE